MPGSIVFAGIAPHPPLLIPEVGGTRIEQVADSQRALTEFCRRLLLATPIPSLSSRLIPRSTQALLRRARLKKSPVTSGIFMLPPIRLEFPNDLELIDAIQKAAAGEDVELRRLAGDQPLDHGALVPLYYLHKAGWRGPIVVIGFTLQSIEKHLSFGRAIANAAEAINRRLAVVASGDLSHRLIVGGPYDTSPRPTFLMNRL
jgi:hypothetical protein